MPIKGFEFATSWPESDRLVERLADAVRGRQALTALDWTRVLLLTELTWTSTLVGAGTDFAPYLVALCTASTPPKVVRFPSTLSATG